MAPPARRPLRRQSKKTARNASKRRRVVRDAIVAQGGRCAGLDLFPDHPCTGMLVGHEPLKRSAGGDPCDPSEVIAICDWLNGDIEDRSWLYKNTDLWVSGGTRYIEGRYVRRRDVAS